MKDYRDYCVVFINGQRHDIKGSHAFMMAADYLRTIKYLTGTKIVCQEGDCGACSIAIYRSGDEQFVAINACIVTMAQLDGAHIITVEGLKEQDRLSPVQQCLMECHASQCGFCTPGFAIALTTLMDKQSGPLSAQKVKNELTGNLCRCTGYTPFIEAALSVDQTRHCSLKQRYVHQEIEPSEKSLAIKIRDEHRELYAPTTLLAADNAIKDSYKLSSGNTDLGVLVNKNKRRVERMLSLHLIDELHTIIETDQRITLGARTTLHQFRSFLSSRIPQMANFIDLFASPQIKNMATVVGNIANGSPIADTVPFFMVMEADVHIRGPREERIIPINDFYQGYKIFALKPDEYITRLSFSLPQSSMHLALEKVSTRKDLDISTVNAAFLLKLHEQKIECIKIAMGGVGPTVIRLKKTENFLAQKELSLPVIEQAQHYVQEDIAPISDVRATKAFRRVLAHQLFNKFMGNFYENSSTP